MFKLNSLLITTAAAFAVSASHAAPATPDAPVLVAQASPTAAPPAAGGAPLYKVVDGTKVDPETLKGFHAWRSAACDRCHGANQEGMVGPSLIQSLKTMSKEDFIKTLKEGRLDKGMPSWNTNPTVMDNINQLYAYLKGRSDGAITKARVEPIQ